LIEPRPVVGRGFVLGTGEREGGPSRIMENATRRNRKARRQGLVRSPKGKARTKRSTPASEATQRAGRPVGADKPNARRKSTVTTRKAQRQKKGAAKVVKAVMPKRARRD
jgi:hypothetical protein